MNRLGGIVLFRPQPNRTMTIRALAKYWWTAVVLPVADAQVILNEIVASNDARGYLAADGIAYDWIELHNAGDLDVDLVDHYLTDDPTSLTKWQFPRSFVVPASGYSMVFASDRNALVEGQEHTNFKLNSGDGEYLALVAPDGVTILNEFSPGFPSLMLHHSFGPPSPGIGPELLLEATPGAPNSEAAPTPAILFFASSEDLIVSGDPVTIEWDTENAANVTLQGTTEHPPAVDPSGSLTLRPELHQSYTLIARNEYGVVRETLDISVTPKVKEFTASPATLATGGKTVLRWVATGSNHQNSLDNVSGHSIRSPLLFTPTNETLVELDALWRKAPVPLPTNWEDPALDDSDWPQIPGPIHEAGNYRIDFHLDDPAALTSYTLVAPNGISLGITLNGTPLPSGDSHLPPSLSAFEFIIDPEILVAGRNVLTFSVHRPFTELPIKVAAWRPQPVPVEVPVTLNSTNEFGGDSQTITLTILPPDTDLAPLPSVAITEFFWSYDGTFPVEPYRFFEINNFGDIAVDLTSFQLVGSQTFSFRDTSDPILEPGEFAVIVTYHPGFAEQWPGDRNVIGQFENPQAEGTYQFQFREGILDPYGRLFEYVDAEQIGLIGDFLDTVERADPRESSRSPDNWYVYQSDLHGAGQGTPGEAPFRILDLSFTPEFASPGDQVTLNWQVSREADLTLLDHGPLTGTSGSIPMVVPEDARSFFFKLRAQTQFQIYEQRATLILPPAIAYFHQSKTAITPGDEVRLSWSFLNEYSSFNATIDPELPSPAYGSPTFTPMISGFPTESYWRYRTFNEPPPENWTSPDGAKFWRANYTPIGFGKDNLRFELTPSDWLTTYFHKSFVVREVEEINGLFLDLLFDDGVAVYLNGHEVLRENLPEGELGHLTPALAPAPGNGLSYRTFEIDPSHLIEGDNVIAVSVHNTSADDLDFVFDLGLRAQRPVPESGRKNYTLTTSNIAGTSTAEITILFAEPQSEYEWQSELGLTGDPATTDTDGDGLYDLLEFATGTDPKTPNPSPLQITISPDRTLTLSFPRNLLASDALLGAEVSDDLLNWTNVGSRTSGMTFRQSVAPEGTHIAEVIYQSYAPVRSGKKYFRLRAR
ncbi:MAG: lamin tail domain-containing protein [Akkermansiaceae bacterium]